MSLVDELKVDASLLLPCTEHRPWMSYDETKKRNRKTVVTPGSSSQFGFALRVSKQMRTGTPGKIQQTPRSLFATSMTKPTLTAQKVFQLQHLHRHNRDSNFETLPILASTHPIIQRKLLVQPVRSVAGVVAAVMSRGGGPVARKLSAGLAQPVPAGDLFARTESLDRSFSRRGSMSRRGSVSSGGDGVRQVASGEGAPIRRLSSDGNGRSASCETGFGRVTSTLRRSIVARKLIVRTLARGGGRRPDQSLDPHAKHSQNQIDSFCKHLIGADHADLVAACVDAIEKEPHERSLLQLRAMMDFVQTCPSFRECTVVEKFIMVRSSRLLHYREGHEVYRPGDAHTQIYVILRGKVAVRGEEHERVLVSGQAFGCTDMQRLMTGIGVYPGDGDEMDLFTQEAYTVRADADLLCVDCAEYRSVYEHYVQVVEEGQNGVSYVASFLASLDIFRNWPWCDVVDLAGEVQGVQVDKGITLFRGGRCHGQREKLMTLHPRERSAKHTQGAAVDGIHILHKGECSIESSDPDPPADGHSESPGAGSGPRNVPVKPQRQYGVLVSMSSDDHGLPLLSLSKHARRRSVQVASCGPRTVFGEELATGGKTRRFTVRMTASSFFLFIPLSVLTSMQSERKKAEKRAMVDAELVLLSKNRDRWLPPRAARLLEAEANKMKRHGAHQRAVSPRKLTEGIAGRT